MFALINAHTHTQCMLPIIIFHLSINISRSTRKENLGLRRTYNEREKNKIERQRRGKRREKFSRKYSSILSRPDGMRWWDGEPGFIRHLSEYLPLSWWNVKMCVFLTDWFHNGKTFTSVHQGSASSDVKKDFQAEMIPFTEAAVVFKQIEMDNSRLEEIGVGFGFVETIPSFWAKFVILVLFLPFSISWWRAGVEGGGRSCHPWTMI